MTEDTLAAARRWLAELERRWTVEAEPGSPAEAKPATAENGRPTDSATRQRILALLHHRLEENPPDRRAAGDEAAALRAENARLREQLQLSRTAYDYLVRLAHHFSGEEVSFHSPVQIRTFCERIKHSVDTLVREFQELLSGRKKVQSDWSLYSSSVAAGGGVAEGTAFIRHADLHGDLGRYLFDWKTTAADGAAQGRLKSVIDELKHHQLALMAGYERCVRDGALAILRELDPAVLETEFFQGGRSGGTEGGFHWRKLIPFRSLLLWRCFRRRYTDIAAEDAQWFQARFLPLFRQGYKEYMWAKLSAQSAQRSRPGGSEHEE